MKRGLLSDVAAKSDSELVALGAGRLRRIAELMDSMMSDVPPHYEGTYNRNVAKNNEVRHQLHRVEEALQTCGTKLDK